MKIQIDGLNYELDTEKAQLLGALKRKVDTATVILNEDEIAMLVFVLGLVGGPPAGARGHVNTAREKLMATGLHLTNGVKLELDSRMTAPNCIYFV